MKNVFFYPHRVGVVVENYPLSQKKGKSKSFHPLLILQPTILIH